AKQNLTDQHISDDKCLNFKTDEIRQFKFADLISVSIFVLDIMIKSLGAPAFTGFSAPQRLNNSTNKQSFIPFHPESRKCYIHRKL
ncbi:MAG: hypothetical protein JW861_02870, partial [Bacteroidales bacterium]|nr:hypothetical protein [Bacteroidales bacterium]